MRLRRSTPRAATPDEHSIAGLTGFDDVEPVAAGGTSQVFRARQPAFDRTVAIKVLSVSAADRRTKARFERELALTGRLGAHPNVVTVHDHGISATGHPYLVLPWYEGGSLSDAVRRRGALPVPEVLRYGVKIAAALAYAHDQGLVHRDVKPANILLSGFDEPALADFGVSVLLEELDGATMALTPIHTSPEVLQGEPATARADVWSLGSTLFTALAGRPPFATSAQSESREGLLPTLMRLAAEPLPPFTRGDVPPDLRAALEATLEKRAADRLPDALTLARRLQAVQAQLGLSVTEIPTAGATPARPGPRQQPDPRSPTAPRPAPVVGLFGDPDPTPRIAPLLSRDDNFSAPPTSPGGLPVPPPQPGADDGPATLLRARPERGAGSSRTASGGGKGPGATGIGSPGLPGIDGAGGSGAQRGASAATDWPGTGMPGLLDGAPTMLRHPEPVRSKRGRLPVAVAALVAVLVLGGGGAFWAASRDGGEPPRTTPAPTAGASPGTAVAGAPTDVRVTATTPTTISLAWNDPHGGSVVYAVVFDGRQPPTGPPSHMARRSDSVVVPSLRPDTEYCLRVLAVLGPVERAPAEPVCARTKPRSAS